MNLTNLSNAELGQLKAQIDKEIINRENDDGFSEAYINASPPTGPNSCFDNALKWDWLNYIKQHGAYNPNSTERDFTAYSKITAALDSINYLIS
jgi:hypothetical protein